jgi:alcohol dehydrogenase class IV
MEKIVHPMPPVIAIPTTSGTGSEVSRGAMITDTKRNVKELLRAGAPSLALVDPELALGMPPHLTASTGMDALSHNIETFLSPRFHPVADGIACEGIRLVGENLVAAVEDGKNQKARMLMAMASTLGALAFQKGTGTTHALAHQLSPEFGVPHGVAIAIMLPHVMEFNRDVAREKLARIAFAMGEKSPAPEGAIQAVDRLRQKVGLPGKLSEVKVVEKGIPLMAQHAMEDPTRLTNPRPCTENDMATLYRKAL